MTKIVLYKSSRCAFIVFSIVLLAFQSAHAIVISVDSKKQEIYISGEFNENDDVKLRSLLETKTQQFKTVSLSSPGGNLLAGLRMGEIIRRHQLTTNVPKNSICASACGFAWLGGTKKSVEEKGNVGFHASYVVRDGIKTEIGTGNALIGSYMSRLGYSDLAIIFATRAAPTQMSWLSPEDGMRLGIDFEYLGLNLSNKKPDTLISRSDFEIAMNENPLINAMRYEDQNQYRDVIEKLYSAFSRGVSERQLSSLGTTLTYRYATKKVLSAPDKTIIEFILLQRSIFKKLEKIDPISCTRAHNGEISIINSMLDTKQTKRIYNDMVRHHPVSYKLPTQDQVKAIYLSAIKEAVEINKESLVALNKRYNYDKVQTTAALDSPKRQDDARIACKFSNDVNDVMIKNGKFVPVYRYTMNMLLENKVPQFKIR
jgi:hypothetical protein